MALFSSSGGGWMKCVSVCVCKQRKFVLEIVTGLCVLLELSLMDCVKDKGERRNRSVVTSGEIYQSDFLPSLKERTCCYAKFRSV